MSICYENKRRQKMVKSLFSCYDLYLLCVQNVLCMGSLCLFLTHSFSPSLLRSRSLSLCSSSNYKEKTTIYS